MKRVLLTLQLKVSLQIHETVFPNLSASWNHLETFRSLWSLYSNQRLRSIALLHARVSRRVSKNGSFPKTGSVLWASSMWQRMRSYPDSVSPPTPPPVKEGFICFVARFELLCSYMLTFLLDPLIWTIFQKLRGGVPSLVKWEHQSL